MITLLAMNFILLVVGFIFQQLPVVDHLPTIAGYDIDTALVTGVGYMRTFAETFWYIGIVFEGFGVLMAYYAIKLLAKLFFGNRSPTS